MNPETTGTSAANDAGLAIHHEYEVPRSPALLKWVQHRTEAAPPYRPRVMVYSGIGSPQMTADRLQLLQQLGAESFLIATDLPSQLGFDPDHELCESQVGRAGVSCADLADFRRICSGLDFDRIDSIGTLSNSIGHIGVGMAACILDEHPGSGVRLVMQNDPLKEFTARGTEIFSPEQALRIAVDSVSFALDSNIPGYAITVCSNHYDVAGAGPVTATAMAMANAIAYVDALIERGHDAAVVAEHMMFFLNERSDLFVGVALYRVARQIWSDLLSQRYGVSIGAQPSMTLMGYAHGLEAAVEPLVNVARCTLSVAAAVLGGVDYLCAAAYDEALRVPSDDAAALAVRTMQVVGMEHGVGATIDSLAGSAKLHDLEGRIYEQIRLDMVRIAECGGAVASISNGTAARMIDEGRGRREAQIDSGARAWIGVNVHQAPQHRKLFSGSSAPALDLDRCESNVVDELRRRRKSAPLIRKELDAVNRAASSDDNLVPPTITALRAGATVQQLVEATAAGVGGRL